MTFASVAVEAAKSHMPDPSDAAKPRKRVCEGEMTNRDAKNPGELIAHLKRTISGTGIKSPYSYKTLGRCNYFS